MRYINRPHRLSSLLLDAGILLLSLLAIAITQASNLTVEGGLLFLNVPALEIIPKGAILNRLSLGIGEKPDSGLIINTAIRPFTGVAHMTRTVTSVVPAGNGSTVSAPLFTQENIFTSNGKEAVTHETYYSATNERAYLRRLARLANNHAAAPAYGPVQEGQQPPVPSTLATVDTSSLLARSLRILLMAMGPATDGQVLSYQKGKLVWIDIDEAYSSLHPISSGRIPYVQPADGSPVERHYGGGGGGGGNQTSGSTSGGSQRDFSGEPINLSSEVTGILAVSRGGTGLSSIGSGSLLLGNAAGTFTDFGIGSNGQVLTVTPTGGLMWSSVAVTGLSQLYADLHYVKQTGDTMTGGLVINLKSGYLGLNILQTASGAYIHAEKGLSSSGTLTVVGVSLLKNDTTVKGTLSGAALRIMGTAGFSGTTVFTKDVRFNSTLTINGQTYTFASSQTPSGYLKTDGAGNLTWSTTPAGFGSGQVVTIGDSRYVRTAGGTMTGALTVRAAISGSSLNISNNITTSGAIIAKNSITTKSTFSGAGLILNGNANISGNISNSGSITTNGSINARTSLSGAALRIMNGDSYLLGNIAIGKTSVAAGTKLDVVGTISGSQLKISSLISGSGGMIIRGALMFQNFGNCTLKTDGNGNVTCGTDLTGGGSSTFGSGNVITIGDSRYIRTAGGTMTGALTVRAAISGSSLNISNNITTSGSIIAKGTGLFQNNLSTRGTLSGGLLTIMNGNSYIQNGSLSIGKTTVSAGTKLDVVGTISGSALKITGLISGSGGILINGNATFRGTLSGSSLTVSSLKSCAMIITDGNGVTSCGNAFTMTAADARYLRLSGGTMTGALTVRAAISGSSLNISNNITTSGSIIAKGTGLFQNNLSTRGTLSGGLLTIMNGNSYIQNGSLSIGKTTVSAGTQLDVVGTISGSQLKISSLISGSGGMIIRGALMFQNFGNCTLKTDGNGNVTCGTDLTGGGSSTFGSGNVITIGDSRYVRTAGGTMTGALTVRATISGSSLNISGNITNSGSIVTKGNITTKGTLSGANLFISGNAMIRGTMSGKSLVVTGTGSQPLIKTDNRYGTIMMGTGAMKNGTGAMAPQLYVAGRVPTTYVGSGATQANPSAITVQGRFAYVVNYSGNSFQIFDISNKQPQLLSTTTSGISNPYGILVQGRYAYVQNYTGASTIRIYDISNPATPIFMSAVGAGGTQASIAIQGRYLYSQAFSGGIFRVTDISNPSNPYVVGSITYGNYGGGVTVSGRYAYVSNSFGTAATYVVDVSNPANPFTAATISSGFRYTTLKVIGKYLYMGSSGGLGIKIYDISNPLSAVLVSTISNNITSFDVSGRYLYATNGSNGLLTFDISNPRVPTLLGTTSVGSFQQGISVQGRYAYTIDYNNSSINVFDLGGAYIQQLEVGSLETTDLAVTNSARIFGNLDVRGAASFGQGFNANGLSAISSTSTGGTTLTLISTYSGALRIAARGTSSAAHIMFGTGTTYDVSLRRSTGLVLMTNANFYANSFSGTSLTITGTGSRPLLRTNTPTNTILIGSGTISLAGTSTGAMTPNLYTGINFPSTYVGSGATSITPYVMKVQGRLAYVANYNQTAGAAPKFDIYDVSNPQSPIQLSSTSFGTVNQAIANLLVSGHYVYLSNFGNSRTYVFDVSNPTSPILISNPLAIADEIQGRYMFGVAPSSSTLTAYDISNPSNIVTVGTASFANSTQTSYMAAQGKYLYATNGTCCSQAMSVFDISNPSNMVKVGTVSTSISANTSALLVQGRYVYLASGVSSTVQIIDVSTPSNPTLVRTLSVGSGNNGRRRLSLQGRFLYVTDLSGVITVIDVSNPRVAKAVGTIPYVGTINDVSVQGRYLYALNGSKNAINTFDIGGTYIQQLEVGGIETSQLSVRGSAAIFGELNVAGGGFFGRGIYVQGQSSFINTSTGSNAFTIISTYSGALRIATRGTANTAHIMFGTGTTYDVSLRRPTGNALQTNANFYAESLSGAQLSVRGTMSGQGLYISGTGSQKTPLISTNLATGTVQFGSGFLQRGSTGAIVPQLFLGGKSITRPVGSGSYATTATMALAVQGRYAYVSNSSNQLVVRDLTNPETPTTVGTSTAAAAVIQSIVVQGRYAYVGLASSLGMNIYDISNPSAPRFVSTLPISGAGVSQVAVQGRYAFIGTGTSYSIYVADVSDPSAPVIVSVYANPTAQFATPAMARLTVQGRYLYVAASGGNLYIFDTSNPRNLVLTSNINTQNRITEVQVQGRYAYVSGYNSNGLQIFDISNPSSVGAAVGRIVPAATMSRMVLQGRYLYISTSSSNILVYDVSNPRLPFQVGTLTAPGYAVMAMQGRYLYSTYPAAALAYFNVFDLGGAYIQQLEVGALEAATLSVRTNATIFGDLNVQGEGVFGHGVTAHGASTIMNTSTGAYALSITSRSGALVSLGSGGSVVPTAALYIETKNSDNIEAIRIRSRETTATQDMFKIITDVSSTDNTVFRISGSGAVYADGVYNSSGADYAEWFKSKDADLMPGDVVCIDPLDDNAVKRCTRDADANLMGIISTNPAFIGNRITGADGVMPPGYKLVGLIGQVPAKVTLENGPVHPGDSLTSASKPGFARRAKAGESTVGVALESFGGTGATVAGPEGVINVLISRRNQSLTVEGVEQKVLDSIAAMKIDDQVNQMVGDTIRNFNLDDNVTTAVRNQLESLDIASQVNRIIDERLSSGPTISTDDVATILQDRYGLSTHSGATVVTADMFVSGALRATSGTFTNLRVESGATIFGPLHAAGGLSVSSGATIQGGLRIDGPITTGSGFSLGSLTLSGAQVNIGSLLDRSSLKVIGGVTINGLAVFLGDVEVKGEFKLSSKQVGYAVIPQTGTSVTVLFSSGFIARPIVTASPDYPILFAVSKATATGFTIRIASPAPETITFSWIAIPTDAPRTSSGTTMTGSFIAFPVDSLGVPVSTNAIWNACVRNQTVLDSSGQPFSCSRYHTDAQWDHPDLHMTFTWNNNHDPKILILPVGYQAVVQEQGNTLTVSSSSSSEQSSSSSVSEESSSSSSESSSESSVSTSSSSSEESSSSSSESSESSSQSSTSSSESSSSSSESSS